MPEADKCKNCSPDKFCPRGPYQNICIKHEDIKSIVSFAQMPQRIVLIYNEPYVDAKGDNIEHIKIQHQMTWNFPSYTKTSKFIVNLIAINKGLNFELSGPVIKDEKKENQFQTERSNTKRDGHETDRGTPDDGD